MTEIRTVKMRKLAIHLGGMLREARGKARLTQADVAEQVGLVTEVYGRVERGMMLPSLPSFRKICVALRLDANLLLGLEVGKSPDWLSEYDPPEELSPELRKVVRSLRQMNGIQLDMLQNMARLLLRYKPMVGEEIQEE
jgi:transcriptional regulator with XRE-family HTH domain